MCILIVRLCIFNFIFVYFYCYICVFLLLYLCIFIFIFVYFYCYICVFLLIYLCIGIVIFVYSYCFVCLFLGILFHCLVLCVVCVLFLCICVLYYCHRLSTQLQLTNISYHFLHNTYSLFRSNVVPKFSLYWKRSIAST
jgi:hypothetical protein